MNCNLTQDCTGTLQIKPEVDDSIKFSLECDKCKETKIVQRTRDELIELYHIRIIKLRAGASIQDIYSDEAQGLLHYFEAPADGLKYLPIAEQLAGKLEGLAK